MSIKSLEEFFKKRGEQIPKDKVTLVLFHGDAQDSKVMNQIVDFLYSNEYGSSLLEIKKIDVFADREGMEIFLKNSPPHIKNPPFLIAVNGDNKKVAKTANPNQDEVEGMIETLLRE